MMSTLFLILIALILHTVISTVYVDDGFEPPINSFLADSPWPQSQRNSYAQASSPFAGPTQADELEVDYLESAPGGITLSYSNPDSNGDRSLWQNNVVCAGTVDTRNEELKDSGKHCDSVPTLDPIAGAYTLLDVDGIFYAPREATLRSFQNEVAGDPFSSVIPVQEFPLPDSAKGGPGDNVRGIGMLYDGNLVFSTAMGVVGVIGRDFTGLQTLKLEGEEISNSLSLDEEGGIYVVTSKKMHRIQWDSNSLSIAWSADYDVGPDNPAGGRLGPGSGSTPTLMGTGSDTDKFVVITDGQELTHLVLFWRDKIPADWKPIAPGKDIRIAAEVPVTFGDPNAVTAVTEQSVLVRGYGAMVVNNDYGVNFPGWVPALFQQLFVVVTNKRPFAPYGVEKFEWDSTTRTLESVWSNDISCPNGIPTMSAATNLAYCVGQRKGVWNIEAMDWSTGESVFFKELGQNVVGKSSVVYNSAYAATTVGINGEILSGVFSGIVRARIKA